MEFLTVLPAAGSASSSAPLFLFVITGGAALCYLMFPAMKLLDKHDRYFTGSLRKGGKICRAVHPR